MTSRALSGAVSLVLLSGSLIASFPGSGVAANEGKGAGRAAVEPPVVTQESLFGRNLPDPAAPGLLPEGFVLARVGDHPIVAGEFARAYDNAHPETRPPADSTGRVTFLRSMIQKELLAAEARRVNRQLTFEDRILMREYSSMVYSNVLYQRAVMDSVNVSEEDVRRAYQLFQTEVRVRHIMFTDRELGERVRRDLLAGRIGWSTAVRRHSRGTLENDGDMGWLNAGEFGLEFAVHTHVLRPGQMSDLVRSRDGWELFQCMERREARAPSFDGLATLIRGQLQSVESSRRAGALQDLLATQIGFELDTVNVRWASTKFKTVSSLEIDGRTPVMSFDASLPEFASEDTGRVLARYRGGQLTLSGFLDAYSRIQPMLRPNVNDFWLLKAQVLTAVLEPFTTQLAIDRGIDRDPVAVRMVENRREEILVEHLYNDSIASKISISPSERNRHYEENRHHYVSWASVRYAAITRPSRAGIDSVQARIRAGESAVAILRADSLAGYVSGSVQVRSQADQGTPYYRILFEELRSGQHTIIGPDRAGDFLLIALLERNDGRQLSFEEVQQMVDESLQSIAAERLLDRMLLRLTRALGVTWRPDLVTRIDLRRPL